MISVRHRSDALARSHPTKVWIKESNVWTYIELAFYTSWELDTLEASLELINILDGGTQLVVSLSYV